MNDPVRQSLSNLVEILKANERGSLTYANEVGAAERALSAKGVHLHIDSSGIFECPMGTTCKLPEAGQVFDAMLGALQEVSRAYQQMFSVMPVAWQTYDNMVDSALKLADGKGKRQRQEQHFIGCQCVACVEKTAKEEKGGEDEY